MVKPTAKQRLDLEKRYDQYIQDQAGILHNKIAVFIAESKIPLSQVLLVLELLREETIRACYTKYLGK
jgi:hypothetical protein